MENFIKSNQILNNVIKNNVTESIKTSNNVWYIYKEDGMISVDADRYYNSYAFAADDAGALDTMNLVLDILNNNFDN